MRALLPSPSAAGSGASYSISGSYYARESSRFSTRGCLLSVLWGRSRHPRPVQHRKCSEIRKGGNQEEAIAHTWVNSKPECRSFNSEVCSSHGRFERITDAPSRYLPGTLICKFACHAKRNALRGATSEPIPPHRATRSVEGPFGTPMAF